MPDVHIMHAVGFSFRQSYTGTVQYVYSLGMRKATMTDDHPMDSYRILVQPFYRALQNLCLQLDSNISMYRINMTEKTKSSNRPAGNPGDTATETFSERDEEINTAAAILSLSGPCRGVGDVYLACVATAGLGQCRHLRASFEQCAKATASGSKEYLGMLGELNSPPDEKDKELYAAQMVNRQLMAQFYSSSSSSNGNTK
jgi:hypothetical protein